MGQDQRGELLNSWLIPVGASLAILWYNWLYRDNLNGAYRAQRTEKLDASLRAWLYLGLQVAGHVLVTWSLVQDASPTWPRLAGLLITSGALWLLSVAKRTLGANYSPCQDSYVPYSVTSGGIYSYIRHPLYTANMLYFFGLFLIADNTSSLFCFIAISGFFVRSAMVEESALSAKFPDYVAYQRSTKRFIPGVY